MNTLDREAGGGGDGQIARAALHTITITMCSIASTDPIPYLHTLSELTVVRS